MTMRRSNGRPLLMLLLLMIQAHISLVCGEPVSLPEIEHNAIGRLGFLGDYAGLSPYKDTRQFESISDPAAVVLQQESIYKLITPANGNILSTCRIGNHVYIGGNFTLLNQTQYNYIAQYELDTNTFSALQQGVDGAVQVVFCDVDRVYVGGDFNGPIGVANNSQTFFGGHAAIWDVANANWIPVPWGGFNGPVYSITRNPTTQTVLFGGSFDATGDGQYFNSNTSQTVNLGSPTQVSAGNSALSGNVSNPANAVCNQASTGGEPWLLQDNMPGYWEATFPYPLQPSVFRIANTHYEGRGTREFSIIALGSNEYFELSYVDPVTHQLTTCTVDCVLSNDTSLAYQDFTVLNGITATAIRIQIDSWYGAGGGLSDVQIFQSDIGVYPHLPGEGSPCSTSPSPRTNVTGTWEETFVYSSYQNYMTSSFPATDLHTTNSAVTYMPFIPGQGVYDVYATTPGCVGSSTCNQRTQIDLTLQLTPGMSTTVTIDQTNTEDQTTLIYSGLVAASSSAFQPTITLTVSPTAVPPPSNTVTLVADSFQFVRNGTNATLISILEFSPNNYTQNILPAWRPLAEQLLPGSVVRALDASSGNTLYIGGSFISLSNVYRNIVSYTGNRLVPLANIGLNGTVNALALLGDTLYAGGDFVNASSLNHAARYNVNSRTWSSLEQGVTGAVLTITPETNTTLTFSGASILGGNAVWDVTTERWTERSSLVAGTVVSTNTINDTSILWTGGIRGAQTYRTDNAVAFEMDNTWSPFLFNGTSVANAGAFWHNVTAAGNMSVLILAGQFQLGNATHSLILNQQGAWRGLGEFGGSINALATIGDTLYIGGQFKGAFGNSELTSFAIYNLATQANEAVNGVYGPGGQPGQVNVIRTRPDGRGVLIGGDFTTVGALDCEAVCELNTASRQWNIVATGLSGQVNDLAVTNDELTAIGNLTLDGQSIQAARVQGQSAPWKALSIGLTPTAVLNGPDSIVFAGASSSTSSVVGVWDGHQFSALDSSLGPGSIIRQLTFVPISSAPSQARYPANSREMLLAVGHLALPTYGNTSVALYDGASWYPFALSTKASGASGEMRHVFYENACCAISKIAHHLPVPAVILISIAVSLGVIFVLVGASMVGLFVKRRMTEKDVPEPMPPYIPGQQRPSSLMAMLDAAQVGTLGAGATAALASAAGPSREKTSDKPNLGPELAGAASTVTAFGALMAMAVANASSEEPISEDAPRLFHAKYPFEAKEYGELGFEAGEPIVVTDASDGVWWMGYKDDGSGKPVSGLFPSNYVSS